MRTNGVMIAECLAWLKAVDGMLVCWIQGDGRYCGGGKQW